MELVALIVTILLSPLGIWLVRKYRRTWGLKRHSYKLLRRLAANVPIEHFNDVLGAPRQKREHEPYIEYSFANRYFYVQAITDAPGTVVRYAVTTRNHKFNPVIWPSEYQPGAIPRIKKDMRLGKVDLAEELFDSGGPDPVNQDGIHATLGASRWEWVETYYTGGPGNYQIFFVALNDGGWLQDPLLRSRPPSISTGPKWGPLVIRMSTAMTRSKSSSAGKTSGHSENLRSPIPTESRRLTRWSAPTISTDGSAWTGARSQTSPTTEHVKDIDIPARQWPQFTA